jgi:hypothetical protein
LTQQTWFDAHPTKAKFLVFFICVVLVEIGARALVWFELLPYTRYPTNVELKFWTRSEPMVGIWHEPNASFDDDRQCFEAHLESNSMGARDRERLKRLPGKERVIVLGDSLIEGLGVEYGDRVTEILEARTGIEHMNVASISWATIQQWLFYENYASDYDHTAVFLFIFPGNDFGEMDPEVNSTTKYKPYLRNTGEGMEVYYPVEFKNRQTIERSRSSAIKNAVENNFYLLNVLRFAWRTLKQESWEKHDRPYYDDFSDRGLEVMLYALDGLARATEGRPLYLITIPHYEDIRYVQETGGGFRLIDELNEFARQHEHVELIDLLPYLRRYLEENDLSFEALTLGCDWHWGVLGNTVVAEALVERIYSE